MALQTVGLFSRGDVWAQRWVNGAVSPNLIPMPSIKFEFQIEAEQKKRRSKGRGAKYNTVTGAVTLRKDSMVKWSAQEMSSETAAILLLGTAEALSVSGGTVTGESMVFTQQGMPVKAVNDNISSVAIAGSVLDTDFRVHKEIGAVEAIIGGNIADGTTKSANYSYSAITGKRIAAGADSQVDLRLIFDAEWIENGSMHKVVVPKLTSFLTSPIDLLPDDYVTLQFEGSTILLPNETSDLYWDIDLNYA